MHTMQIYVLPVASYIGLRIKLIVGVSIKFAAVVLIDQLLSC